MKIRDAEIAAAKDADTRLSTVDAVRILNAILKVRRARKQAKRERQRKEKDKQVVESVKPTHFRDKPIAGMSQFKYDEMVKVQAGLMAPKFGSSKAPEWDGTFGVGEWMTQGGDFARVSSVKSDYLMGTLRGYSWTWSLDGGQSAPDDLIRPWPKGEQ